ncbi:MAG TPA: hypothetical protein VMM57_00145 [Bacteroidota bacterium]|nr:hypothetical protein [Bacteroidota bacterium]
MGIRIQTSDYKQALRVQMDAPPAGVRIQFQPSVERQRSGFEAIATFVLEIEKTVRPKEVSAWLCHEFAGGEEKTITIGQEVVRLTENEVTRVMQEHMRADLRARGRR